MTLLMAKIVLFRIEHIINMSLTGLGACLNWEVGFLLMLRKVAADGQTDYRGMVGSGDFRP